MDLVYNQSAKYRACGLFGLLPKSSSVIWWFGKTPEDGNTFGCCIRGIKMTGGDYSKCVCNIEASNTEYSDVPQGI
jgi:hypothetical protein